MSGPLRSRPALRLSALVLAAALSGCGGGGPSPSVGGAPTPSRATDEEWRALATPRPQPLAGAPRVAVTDMQLSGRVSWPTPPGVTPTLGATELINAGLLRRPDVDFVERRRFAAAAEAERRGSARPRGAPPAGLSRGAEFIASVIWSALPGGGRLDVRLSAAASGEVVARWNGRAPADADPLSLARLAVGGILASLDSLGARPAWSDADPASAPTVYQDAGISPRAVASFFGGLAAEESWSWEAARLGYQGALGEGGASFVEAAAALARTARLRNGGTLGVS